MPLRPRGISLVCVALLSLALSTSPRVTMKVRPAILISMSDVQVEVRIPPQADNRYLLVQWDSDSGGAGKRGEELSGADDAVLHTFEIRDVVPANYVFEARVLDANGRTLGLDRAEIHTPPSR